MEENPERQSEYKRVFAAYREAHLQMLQAAQDPQSSAEDFRAASDRVSQLTDVLQRLRVDLDMGAVARNNEA
jgi:hypothetical protein